MKISDILFEGQGPAGWKKNYAARIDIDASYSTQMKNRYQLDPDKKKAAYKAAKEKFAELQKAHETGLLFKTVDEAKEYMMKMEYPNWPMFVQNTKGTYVKYRGDKVVVDAIKDKTVDDVEVRDAPKDLKIPGVEVTIPGVSSGPLISFIRLVMLKAVDAKKAVYNKLGRAINVDSWNLIRDFKSNSVIIKCTKAEAEEFIEQAKQAEKENEDYKVAQKKADEEYRAKEKKDKEDAAASKKQRHADLSEKYGKSIANMVAVVEDKKEWKANRWSVEIRNKYITKTMMAEKLTIEQAHKKQEELMIKLQKGYNPTKAELKWCVSRMYEPSPLDILALKVEGGKITSNMALALRDGTETKLPHSIGKVKGFVISGFKELSSVENFPEEVENNLYWYGLPKLTSLKDIHKYVKKCKRIEIDISGSDIKSNILGLLMIEGLQKVDYSGTDLDAEKAFKIINNYLGQGREGILKAQQELIDADLDDYAET